MRLMCSQDQAEVEGVKDELLKAGIPAETRRNPVAEALGVNGVELWVNDERDFCEASRLYEEMQDRAPAVCAAPPANSQGRPAKSDGAADEPGAGDSRLPEQGVKGAPPRQPEEPRHQRLRQASSVLAKGIEEMIQREQELAGECESLRGKVAELSKTLAREQATLAREAESRVVAEKNQAEQVSGLLNALERERREWEQQSKSREDQLKQTQEKLEAASRQLHEQQAAAVALKEEIVSLELQRDEFEKSLIDARTEAVTEREARMAAEERAEKAVLEQKSLEQQLLHHKELEQQMQAYVTSLNSLCGRIDGKAAAGFAPAANSTP